MHTSTSTIRRAPIVLTVLLPIVMLAMPTIPAWAAGSDSAPISMASVRSFPKHPVPHRSFSEAVSTDVDGSWGRHRNPRRAAYGKPRGTGHAHPSRTGATVAGRVTRRTTHTGRNPGHIGADDRRQGETRLGYGRRPGLLRAPIPGRAIRVRGQYACRLGLQWFHQFPGEGARYFNAGRNRPLLSV